jgi:hypothetical protein
MITDAIDRIDYSDSEITVKQTNLESEWKQVISKSHELAVQVKLETMIRYRNDAKFSRNHDDHPTM